MCGRFYVDDEMLNEIEKILKRIDRENLKKGDVYPTDKALVIKSGNDESSLVSENLSWGYKFDSNKNVIFNARSETVLEKPLFKKDFLEHRCVVPAKGFYEWDKEKKKYFVTPEQSGMIYMAGIYRITKEGSQFTILTKDAIGDLREIHERMPLVVKKENLKDWLKKGIVNNQDKDLLKIEFMN